MPIQILNWLCAPSQFGFSQLLILMKIEGTGLRVIGIQFYMLANLKIYLLCKETQSARTGRVSYWPVSPQVAPFYSRWWHWLSDRGLLKRLLACLPLWDAFIEIALLIASSHGREERESEVVLDMLEERLRILWLRVPISNLQWRWPGATRVQNIFSLIGLDAAAGTLALWSVDGRRSSGCCL